MRTGLPKQPWFSSQQQNLQHKVMANNLTQVETMQHSYNDLKKLIKIGKLFETNQPRYGIWTLGALLGKEKQAKLWDSKGFLSGMASRSL